jgi:GT2 family glycosyltransferase
MLPRVATSRQPRVSLPQELVAEAVARSGEAGTPRVSAIVVNWNGGAMLDECLASLFAQTWTNLEVILVDNASVDGSADRAAAAWGERLRVLRNARNEGFARGNNLAFAAATGEWMFLLNTDAVAEPGAIEALMRFVADKPEVGQLACRINRYEEAHVFDSVGLLLYPDGVCRPRGWQEKDLGQYDRAEAVLAPHGCACAYRKAMLDDVGTFDEAYFCYLEDLDLGMRGQLGGWTCWYVPDSRVRHHKSASAGNYSKFKAFHVERNRIWNAIKLLPRFVLLTSPLFTLNRYLMQFYAAKTHAGISAEFVKEYSWWRLPFLLAHAYLAALVRVPRMLLERRRLTKKRRITTRQWYELISKHKLDAIELALKY